MWGDFKQKAGKSFCRRADVCLHQQLSCLNMVVLLSKLWISSWINQVKCYFSVLEWPQLLDRDASWHIRFHSEFGRTCSSSYRQPQKFGIFSSQFSVFAFCHSWLSGGLLVLKPKSLIFGDTVSTPSTVSTTHSGNLSRKRRWEKQSWWGLGSRLATRLKHSTENGSCQEMWFQGRARKVQPPTPNLRLGLSEHFVTCVRYSWSSN